MINNPKEIKELLDTFKEVPGQIIKKAIKEVLAEDKEKGKLKFNNQELLEKWVVVKNAITERKANE